MENLATLIRSGNLEQAESVLKELGNESTSDAKWHHMRGKLLEARGDHSGAIAAFEKSLALNSQDHEAKFDLAYLHDLFGDEETAIEIYEDLARGKAVHVSALMNLAVIYEDHGMYDHAHDCLSRVLDEHPEHARARMFLKDVESSVDMVYDENNERRQEKQDALFDTPVSDFELSVRSRNCLKKMNINTLGDLLRITEVELLAYKNFGETSLNEIKAMLSQKGLRLGQMKEEAHRATRTPSPRRIGGVETSPVNDAMNRFLSEIEFSGRSRKCLQRLGLVTVSDLVNKTEGELLATKNFGQTSLSEIKGKLAELDLSLRKKPE